MAKKGVMRMHQVQIFHIFVPNLVEFYQFGQKELFQWNCGLFKALAAKKNDFRVKKGTVFLVFKGLLMNKRTD